MVDKLAAYQPWAQLERPGSEGSYHACPRIYRATYSFLCITYLGDQFLSSPPISRWLVAAIATCLFCSAIFFPLSELLRGTVLNRTYGTHKNLPGIYLFIFHKQYLVLFTMVPRNTERVKTQRSRWFSSLSSDCRHEV